MRLVGVLMHEGGCLVKKVARGIGCGCWAVVELTNRDDFCIVNIREGTMLTRRDGTPLLFTDRMDAVATATGLPDNEDMAMEIVEAGR